MVNTKSSERYTLGVAAEILARSLGESYDIIEDKVCRAAFDGKLPTFELNQNTRINYRENYQNAATTKPKIYSSASGNLDLEITDWINFVNVYQHESFYDDLNTWLDAHETSITFRFPISNVSPDVIYIPLGTAFISAAELPKVIAESLIPIKPATLTSIVKVSNELPPKEEPWYTTDLPLINELFAGLPELSTSITESKWLQYQKAFDNYPDKPNWNLKATFKNQDAERKRIMVDQFHNMDYSIRSGTLAALSETRIRANYAEKDTIILINDARIYLKTLGFELLETLETTNSSALTDQHNSKNDVGSPFPTPFKNRTPKEFIDDLDLFLNEINLRMQRINSALDKNKMDGTKANLLEVASKFNPKRFSLSLQTFDDYLNGICKFKPGRRHTNAENPYSKLFPEFFKLE